MSSHRCASGLIGLAAVLALCSAQTVAAEASARTVELIEAPGWKLVYAHCSGCHGLDQVASQRGDRTFWSGVIRRMQAQENLWQFDPRTEAQILAYLSSYYGEPEFGGRRAPLPARLRPGAAPDGRSPAKDSDRQGE